MEPAAAPALFASSALDDTPASLRRLVLLLYAIVVPPSALVVTWAAQPGYRLVAAASILLICGMGALQVAATKQPTPLTWIYPAGIAPVVSCAIAFAASGQNGLAFVAMLGAPVAWSAVLFTEATVITAIVTAVACCFAAVTLHSGWAVGLGNAALLAIVFGLVGWVVFGRTMRKELKFLRALRLDINDIELVFDQDGVILQCNDRALDAYGYTREEMIGMDVRRLRSADVARVGSQIASVRTEGSVLFETEHYRKDGSHFPVEVSARRVLVEGTLLVHSLIRDVTERNRVLRELQRLSDRLSLAVKAGGVGIWEVHVDTGTLSWDDQMLRLYGLTREEFHGTEADWSSRIHPDDRARAVASIYAALASANEFDEEFRIVLPDGRIRHVRSTALVNRTADGRPHGLIGTNWDVTADKEAAARLSVLAEQAQAANRAKSEFLANMSHEIRTPLHALLGLNELLLDTPIDAEQREYLEMSQTAGRQLRDLLDDILDISKIEAGRVSLDSVDFDLDRLLGELSQALTTSASQKGLQLTVGADAAVPRRLRGDPKRLKQVLTNLVGNGIKFTAAGSVCVQARLLDGTPNAAVVRFSVRDTGIGIPADKMGLLFDKFSQVSGSITRQYGGTGLGLAISKELVTLMGGEIGVESEAGRGTEFWFTARFAVSGT
ncbi:MAG: ATP-binding protein [Vicinamibacterales bacterium]